MRRFASLILAILFLAPAPVLAGPSHVQLWDALIAGLAAQRAAVPDWLAVADSAAARFLDGGRLWVGGSFPDFDGEACHRAGGLMPLDPLRQMGQTPADTLGPRDVVLLGFHAPRPEDPIVVGKLQASGAFVVGFGQAGVHQAAADAGHAWLEAGAPQVTAGAPAAAILSIANLWAFTGEFIAACLRRGQMPTIWQSILMPGSQERNARYRPLRVHPDLLPPPVDAGYVAGGYLDSLQHYLRQYRATEWERLAQAVQQVRAVRARGNTAYVCPLGGHLRPNRLELPATSANLTEVSRYVQPAELTALLRPGDLLYIQGYVDPPGELLAAASAAGAFTAISLAGKAGLPPDRQAADLVLDAQWRLGDAAVPLPGYDVPLLPPSGFMAAAIYWVLTVAAE